MYDAMGISGATLWSTQHSRWGPGALKYSWLLTQTMFYRSPDLVLPILPTNTSQFLSLLYPS